MILGHEVTPYIFGSNKHGWVPCIVCIDDEVGKFLVLNCSFYLIKTDIIKQAFWGIFVICLSNGIDKKHLMSNQIFTDFKKLWQVTHPHAKKMGLSGKKYKKLKWHDMLYIKSISGTTISDSLRAFGSIVTNGIWRLLIERFGMTCFNP